LHDLSELSKLLNDTSYFELLGVNATCNNISVILLQFCFVLVFFG